MSEGEIVYLDPLVARRLQATLDEAPTVEVGEALPALYHWAYGADCVTASQLGPDGHAKAGIFAPPADLPHRMWAGGRIEFLAPLAIGRVYTHSSVLLKAEEKYGRSGRLKFVTLAHEMHDPSGQICLREEQDLVYRAGAIASRQVKTFELAPEAVREIVTPDPVLLFRYSALTFNGHRIHYDANYCRDVEGYPGLVVHGPLVATLLARLATRIRPGMTITRFWFRARAPLFDTAPFEIVAMAENPDSVRLFAQTPEGGVAMEASADFRSAG